MTILEEKQREVDSLEAAARDMRCSTCQRVVSCPIFRAAREMQVVYIPPEIFWCAWHKETV